MRVSVCMCRVSVTGSRMTKMSESARDNFETGNRVVAVFMCRVPSFSNLQQWRFLPPTRSHGRLPCSARAKTLYGRRWAQTHGRIARTSWKESCSPSPRYRCVCICICVYVRWWYVYPHRVPPPQHSSRHDPQHTQHIASTAATPRYPQGKRQKQRRRAGPTQSDYARPMYAYLYEEIVAQPRAHRAHQLKGKLFAVTTPQVCIYIHVYVCMHMYIFIFVMHIYVYMCKHLIYVHIYVCIYIYRKTER